MSGYLKYDFSAPKKSFVSCWISTKMKKKLTHNYEALTNIEIYLGFKKLQEATQLETLNKE